MARFETRILNTLLDSYEKSSLFAATTRWRCISVFGLQSHHCRNILTKALFLMKAFMPGRMKWKRRAGLRLPEIRKRRAYH